MAAREGASSARRRRDRQLRAWHRHVRTTVAMELATALHHRAQGLKKRVVEEPREEELRHWGVRPAHPLDVSAQPPLVAGTCVAAGVPLLGVPSLADAPAEAIDGRTLRYLLKANLARKKYEEEEEEEKKKQEKAAESRRTAQALMDHAASLPKRKRKKKRKKKLPRSGYKFLPWSRRLFGTNSTLFLREGGPWFLRSILAASCPHGSLQAQDARHLGRYGSEGHLCRGTEFASVARTVRTWKPGLSTSHWYLAVTCAVYSTTRQSRVWSSPLEYKSTDFSGRRILVWFPYSLLLGSTVDTCLASVHNNWWTRSKS